MSEEYYKVDDEVEVYNVADTRVGTVVALLTGYPDNQFPVVVRHGAFGSKGLSSEQQKTENQIFQRFNHAGEPYEGSLAHIRRPRARVVSNVYSDRVKTFGPAMPWCLPDAARFTRSRDCVGYLEGFQDSNGSITGVTYTSLEK